MRLFRVALATFSVSGIPLVKTVKAEVVKNDFVKAELVKNEEAVKGSISEDAPVDLRSQIIKALRTKAFLAEPLTDAEVLHDNQNKDMKAKMELMIMRVQKEFVDQLQRHELPDFKFKVDRWTRPEGGGGVTCVLQNGHVYEKAGVNVSVVHGNLPQAAVKQMNTRGKQLPEGEELPFFAAGISCVIHPRNPNIPTVHFNYRYFEVDGGEKEGQWWFGGGCDLTPYYLDETDAKMFHGNLKKVCDKHDSGYYPKFKAWCDKYFFIPHREVSRGIGGIFFDDLDSPNKEACFEFVKDCAEAMGPTYVPMVSRHKERGYGYHERQWQLLRRGYYAEFNLVYDRGTKFGLFTPGARIESILMSLPLTAKWEYMHVPKPGSREAKLTEILKNPRDWV